MNLAALLTACRKALLGAADWQDDINISRKGFFESYRAIGLSIPAYYLCALAITTQRAAAADSERTVLPIVLFAILVFIYSLTFSASVYFICRLFSKEAHFKPWVIIRHWSIFFCVLLAASLYGLFLLGLLPFAVANYAALCIYLLTLGIDIRLAQQLGEFDMGASIFIACINFAIGLAALLLGLMQIGGRL